MRQYSAWFAILVALLMIVQWTVSLAKRQVPELRTDPVKIAFHLVAELLTAIALLAGGFGLLTRSERGLKIYLLAMGMLFYTIIVSPGYFAQKRNWPMVAMFAMLFLLALISLAPVLL
jgi:hypothetical protein